MKLIMIKRYNDFINENEKITVQLTEEELDLFKREPMLQDLISKDKVKLSDKDIKFNTLDNNTKEILSQYFKI